MATTTTFYMSLVLPNVTVNPEPGPDWASELNAAFALVDAHDHSSGKGTQVPSAGLNINADIPMQNNGLTSAGFLGLGSGTPINASLYQSGGNLYWKNSSGTAVQLTAGGTILSAGSIANLVAPAAVNYSAISGYTFFANSGTGALDKINASSIALQDAPGDYTATVTASGMTADYTMNLPAQAPASTKFLRMTSGGQVNPDVGVDDYTIEISAGNLKVKDGSIGPTQLSAGVGAFPTGGIIPWGGNWNGVVSTFTGPDLATYKGIAGYLYCDGTAVSRTVFADLFAVVGTSYGEGNGTTTFNLPDARGMFLRGWNETQSNPAYSDKDAASRTAMATGGNVGNFPGTVQTDAFESHTHQTQQAGSSGGAFTPIAVGVGGPYGTLTPIFPTTTATGGTETRPQNFAVSYLIKY